MIPRTLPILVCYLAMLYLGVEVTAAIIHLRVRNFLAREAQLVERCNVCTDIVSRRLVGARWAPEQIDVLGSNVFAFATAADGADGVVSDWEMQGEQMRRGLGFQRLPL